MRKIAFLLIQILVLSANLQLLYATDATFIFVRHGQTDCNKEGKLQGRSDIPLNQQGIQEAFLLKKELSKIPFVACFSSPLQRAFKTADILVAGRNLSIEKDDRLLERSFGVFEGRSMKEFRAAQPEELIGVETKEALLARITAYLDEISQSLLKGNVLVVGHSGFLSNMLTHIYQLPPHKAAQITMKNGCYFKMHYAEKGWIIEELYGITIPLMSEDKPQ